MDKKVRLASSFLRRCKMSHIILLLGIVVFLWTSSNTLIAFAQSYGNLLQNANFETGSLSPWVKWGYPRSTVNVWASYNHTPNGSWSGYIIPDGRWVEMQQVWTGNLPVTPGHRYYLGAFVTSNGMTAQVAWWANDNQPSRECGSTSAVWPTYAQISCEFTVPPNISQFNVHLGGNSGQGSGRWAASDDWYLAEPPATTTSWYIGTVDGQTLYNLGCSAGSAYPTGAIVLDFGDPAFANNNYGTYLFYPGNPFASTAQIRDAVEAFVLGYWNCSPPSAYIKVAIATNNHGTEVNSNHGQAWANMVNSVDSWIGLMGYYSKLSVAGASDMEPAWNTAAATRAWADGYDSVNNREYYDYGSCDSCPTTNCPNCQIANNWTKDDVWYVSWGVPPAWPWPLIYATSGVNADQWYRMSLYSYTNHGGRMIIKGSGTQWQACQQHPGTCSNLDNKPSMGWGQLAQWLNLDTRTAQSLDWSTDIKWQYP